MSSPFAITAATNTVLLDNNRQGQTSLTVSNTTPHAIRGRAHIVAQQTTAGSWLTLLGETERDFPGSGSQQYVVQITVPPGASAGDYTFRLDVVDLANPDDNFSEGPTVKFVVPALVPVKKPFPWWIVAVIVALLILVGAGTYGIVQLTHKTPPVTPTAVVTKPTATIPLPSPTPRPTFSLGTWSGQFDSGPIAISLKVTNIQNGAFAGLLSQPHFEGSTNDSVSGTEGSLNHFALDAQGRLQDAIQLFGNGTGTFVDFTNPTLIPNSKGTGSRCVGILNCSFDAVVYADGSLHGVYFYPGHTQHDGTFVLNKISPGSTSTERPLNLTKTPLVSKSVDAYVRHVAAL